MQWPAPPHDAADRHPVRYLNDGRSQRLLTRADGTVPALAFPLPEGRARFLARPYAPARELPDAEYPMVLNTGRVQHQWHTLTKTGKVAKLNKLELTEEQMKQPGHLPTTAIVTPHTEFSEKFLIEMSRGCPEKCRYCWATFGMGRF